MVCGTGKLTSLPVTFLERELPLWNPFAIVSLRLKVPFAAPTETSFCFEIFGINASKSLSYFNLLPDCDAKWTEGVQKPETQIQSQLIFSLFSKPVFELFNFPK